MSVQHTSSRYASRITYPVLLWMIAVALLFGCCGVAYAMLKHEQVVERTEIRQIQREIALCKLNANQYRAKANALTNRWAMRDRLSQDHSDLRDISQDQIEVARRLDVPARMAANLPR